MLESQFLEAYIHLEKLCNEMYDTNHGVSKYIEYMEAEDSVMRDKIPSWTIVYKKLKDLRWKRNQFVHEGNVLFDKNDTDWLIEFYNLIMTGKDPLTLKNILSRKISVPQRNYVERDNVKRVYVASENNNRNDMRFHKELWIGIAFLAGTIIIILASIILTII